jgi:hypothetical protein
MEVGQDGDPEQLARRASCLERRTARWERARKRLEATPADAGNEVFARRTSRVEQRLGSVRRAQRRVPGVSGSDSGRDEEESSSSASSAESEQQQQQRSATHSAAPPHTSPSTPLAPSSHTASLPHHRPRWCKHVVCTCTHTRAQSLLHTRLCLVVVAPSILLLPPLLLHMQR